MRVVVVGAGVIGCAVAFELSRRGATVTMVDMRQPGGGATQASAGVLAPYIEGRSRGLLELGLASLARYDTFMARVREATGMPVEYQRRGSLEVASTDADLNRLRAVADQLAEDGVEHRWLDAAGVRTLEPGVSESILAGLLVATHGYVDARTLVRALHLAAITSGASMATASVRRLSAGNGHVAVRADGRTLEADAVVVAAGSWSGELHVDVAARPRVRPVKGQLLQLRCARPPASRVLWSEDCYLVPWSDGTLLVGATVEEAGFDESATVAGVHGLLGEACRVLPALKDARFDGVRVGLRPGTPDELPVVGAATAAPGVVFATGHYRSGILLAPLTAELVADLLLDGREGLELSIMAPSRFGL